MTVPEQSNSDHVTIEAAERQLGDAPFEAGPLYSAPAGSPPHATWDRYGQVRIHLDGLNRYVTPAEADELGRVLQICAAYARQNSRK